jgi:hypothetical protein
LPKASSLTRADTPNLLCILLSKQQVAIGSTVMPTDLLLAVGVSTVEMLPLGLMSDPTPQPFEEVRAIFASFATFLLSSERHLYGK